MFWHSSPPAVPQGIWHHEQVCLPILLSPQPFKVPDTHFRAFFWLLMANGYICVTMQLVFHDGSPHWQRSLFLVPQFCFCPPFCLLNFVLSYSTWTIISLLLVFYPHSAHSISSSFVFSFALIPHNSLAFFFFYFFSHPTNHQPVPGLQHRKIAKSEIHFSCTCLSLPLSSVVLLWSCPRHSSSFVGSPYLEFSVLFPLFYFKMFFEEGQNATLTSNHTTDLQTLF